MFFTKNVFLLYDIYSKDPLVPLSLILCLKWVDNLRGLCLRGVLDNFALEFLIESTYFEITSFFLHLALQIMVIAGTIFIKLLKHPLPEMLKKEWGTWSKVTSYSISAKRHTHF